MSEEVKTAEDIAKKILTKEFLMKQLSDGQSFIEQAQRQIVTLQAQIQQQVGTMKLAQAMLKTFDIPTETK